MAGPPKPNLPNLDLVVDLDFDFDLDLDQRSVEDQVEV
jgi:hypothetical protein